jgi:DNA helicase IV
LDRLRERARRSLQEIQRAPLVPTPAGRAERDAFNTWHTEQVRRLSAVEERLAFGRLDLANGELLYIGRIGLSDDRQTQLLVDWRAPAAASFYQATSAAPLGVARRRHLSLRGRQVVDIDDELLDDAALAQRGLQAVAGEGALMAALTAHRTGRMRDIVATLQAEQDSVVRADPAGILVVQGGPGTGKTAVALHRAAYLLYTHRERITRSGVLIVGPGPVFLRYIEQVLPSLGETGVLLCTPGQLFCGLDATGSEPEEVAAVKGDLRMAEVIKAAVRNRQRDLNHQVHLVLDGDRITLRPRVVAQGRHRARQSGRPHNEARVIFVKHVLDDLARQLARRRKLDPEGEDFGELLIELRRSKDVRREINLLWLPLAACGFVRTLLSRPDRLGPACAGILTDRERDLLLRPVEAPWTPADAPLLDEAAELIGPDVQATAAEHAARAAAAAERSEILQYARKVLEQNPEGTSMLTAEVIADRMFDDSPTRSVIEHAAEDRTWVFGHAVIDEAQELSPMQWRLLARKVPSRSMTVVGDIAQTGSAAGTTSWAQALDPIAAGRWRLVELTVNYRTPATVMDRAVAVLQAAGVSVTPPHSARPGEYPPVIVPLDGRGPGAVVNAVGRTLRDADALTGGGRHAVLLPAAAEDLAGEIRAALADEGFGAGGEATSPPDSGGVLSRNGDVFPGDGAGSGSDGAGPPAAGAKVTGAPIGSTVGSTVGGLADRVEVMTVAQAKGLEFDGVVVVDPAAIIAASPRGINDLYVALTRTTHLLTVLHHSDPPSGLDAP